MRILSAFIASIIIIGMLDVSYAGDERPLLASAAVEPAPKEQSTLTKEQIKAQIEVEKRKLATLQKLLRAQGGDSPDVAMAAAPKAVPKQAQTAAGDTARFQKLYLREIGYPEEATAPVQKAAPPDPCNPQRFFIRANSLDNYLYGITPASKAKGASISYTDDHVAGTKTATINGMLSYVVLRDLCPTTPPGDAPFFSGYSVAPFILGQGNYTEPRAKTEHSVLKFGVENEFELARFIIPRQVFTFAPYAETDYRGIARVYGANGYWDLYDANLHLGGYINSDPYLGWFVQLRGETDIRQVDAIGVTNLTKTSYAWIGGTARLNMYLFPLATDVPEIVRNRFSLIASANYFTDLQSGMSVHMYSVTFAYKITPDGSSSIGFEYDYGTDKETLVKSNQYLITLSYAY
jgi:hypothetical protein